MESGSGNRGGLKLEPAQAATFALEFLFAISTFIQGVVASWKIRKRVLKHPPSITTPEFDLGPLFPSFLLLSTVVLTILHILRIVMVGIENNLRNQDPRLFNTPFKQAVLAMELAGETIFLAGLFSLVIHRKRMTLRWRAWTEKKTFVDMMLVVVMLGLGLVRVFIIPVTVTLDTPQKIAITYSAVYFTGAMDLFITSSALYGRTKQKESWHREGDSILQHIALPIAFLLVLDALVSLVVDVIGKEVMVFKMVEIVVSGVSQCIMITFCLRLGTPGGSEDEVELVHNTHMSSSKATDSDVIF